MISGFGPRHFPWSALRCSTVKWWSSPRVSAGTILAGVGVIQIGDARGVGILSGLGGDHQCVVALDLQLAAVEQRVVAELCIEANVATGRRVLVAHRFVRGVPRSEEHTSELQSPMY